MAQTADTLTTRDALRHAVLRDLLSRADIASTEIEGGPLDGIKVVSIGMLRDLVVEHLQVDLPPPSEKFAEVVTPAKVSVAAICPDCHLPAGIIVNLTPQLTVTNEGAELAVKAKSKARVHVCGQQSLPLEDEAGQATLDDAIEHIDDLRLRILRAVADVSDAWGTANDTSSGNPRPTVDAIAQHLGLATESERADLEESLHAYSQLEPPLVDVVTVKGQPAHYVLTEAGIALVAEAGGAATSARDFAAVMALRKAASA